MLILFCISVLNYPLFKVSKDESATKEEAKPAEESATKEEAKPAEEKICEDKGYFD